MRDVQFEHLEIVVRLLILLNLRDQGGPRQGREMGEQWGCGAVREHTQHASLTVTASYGCHLCWPRRVGNMALINLLDAGIATGLRSVQNAVSAEHNEGMSVPVACE